jgi:hypothetical protein
MGTYVKLEELKTTIKKYLQIETVNVALLTDNIIKIYKILSTETPEFWKMIENRYTNNRAIQGSLPHLEADY